MAVRSDVTVNWELSPRIITVAAPSTNIIIQDLHDTLRDIEGDLPEGTPFPHLIDSAGKEPLGGGSFVGITATLQNAKLAFEARPGPNFVSCTVTGGNLVAVDANGNNMDPIQTTAYTQVTISQSSSPTIIQPPSDYAALHMIESLRGRSVSVGDIWYWDPTSGVDTNDGTTPSTAVATFAQAQTLASTGSPDNIIFALATSGGITTVTEKITISTPNIKLRGPGYTFQFVPDSAGDTVTISANNAEFSGFYVSTFGTGTNNGIAVTGDNALIKDVWVASATSDGINVSSSSRTTVDTCAIENCAGNGIGIGADTAIAKVRNCIISGNTADGVDFTGTGITDNILENNLIFNNTGWGIDVNASATRTGIRLHHTIAKNTLGTIETTGSTDTFQDTSGTITGGDIDAIVDGVWDELISTHTGTGSTGKTLRDAKVKATLASLK